MKDYIKLLKENDLLKVIDTPCSSELEIAHLSYLEVKKPVSKALLFTNPTNKNGKSMICPCLQIFLARKSSRANNGRKPDEIAARIENC